MKNVGITGFREMFALHNNRIEGPFFLTLNMRDITNL